MSDPYIGEIRMFAGSFAPVGWALCQGQLIPISENDTLFNLIGTTYGGDGQETFALPNLCGRVPMHQSSTFPIGSSGGVETVTLTTQQLPVHSHPMLASSNTASSSSPSANVIGRSTAVDAFINEDPVDAMAASSISPVGGSQPHDNMQPYLCVNFIISLFGIFPSPS